MSEPTSRDGPAREHPNAAAYRRTADAFRAGDVAVLQTLFEPDVVWHLPGRNVRAGDVRGIDAVVALLVGLPPGFTLAEHDVLGSDDHVVALSHMGVRREDFDVVIPVVSVFHFRNGRQSERWFYPSDMDAWNRFLDLPGPQLGGRDG